MPYTKFTWLDEALAGAARYNILEDAGGAFKSTMQINLATTVTQAGSALSAARMNNIEGELQILSDALLYKLAVSVATNDLIITLQHSDGTNPTATRPLYFRIDGVWRAVTTTTTITIVDGTNWFNSGSAELGTKLVGYFPYVVWDSNSSVVALTIARIPYARLVSDFSATTTNEKHCFNFANFTSTDPAANIGYFEATLSLVGTLHLWTVPAFTNLNLRHVPTFETRTMSYTPAFANTTVGNGTIVGEYKLINTMLYFTAGFILGSTSAVSGSVSVSIPFVSTTVGGANKPKGLIIFSDAGGSTYFGHLVHVGSTFFCYVDQANATYATVAPLTSAIPFTWATSDEISLNGSYSIT